MPEPGKQPDHLKPYSFTSENQPEHNGRPKGRKSLTTLLRRILELKASKTLPKGKETQELLELIAEASNKSITEITNSDVFIFNTLTEALNGNMTAIKLVFDRIDGEPDKFVNIGNIDGVPFKQEIDNNLVVKKILDEAAMIKKIVEGE